MNNPAPANPEGYIPEHSERLALTADVVIFNLADQDLKVLLVCRAYPPFKGQWAIPGGFVHASESH